MAKLKQIAKVSQNGRMLKFYFEEVNGRYSVIARYNDAITGDKIRREIMIGGK